jgi:hypothetical protein
VPKFTAAKRDQIQSIVANLSIKRIPTELIRQHVFNKTGKTLSARSLYYIRQRLKRDSFHWYKELREGEYEYIHEFKERINEIVDLQRMHHEIIIKNDNDNDKVYKPYNRYRVDHEKRQDYLIRNSQGLPARRKILPVMP